MKLGNRKWHNQNLRKLTSEAFASKLKIIAYERDGYTNIRGITVYNNNFQRKLVLKIIRVYVKMSEKSSDLMRP